MTVISSLQSRQGILSTYHRYLDEKSGILTSSGVIRDQILTAETRKISRRARLLASLRPPFLDGDFVGPIARTKRKLLNIREWYRSLDRGGSGHGSTHQMRSKSQEELKQHNEDTLTPMERLRKRLLRLRDRGRSALRSQAPDDDDDDF